MLHLSNIRATEKYDEPPSMLHCAHCVGKICIASHGSQQLSQLACALNDDEVNIIQESDKLP